MSNRLLECAATLAFIASTASAQDVAAKPDHGTPMALTSPNKRLAARVWLDDAGAPMYSLTLDGAVVLRDSKLGLVRDDAEFTRDLHLVSTSSVTRVRDRYEILTAKRRLNVYTANRRILHTATRLGAHFDIEFQLSNDGVAFRYVFPEVSATMRVVREERTSFHMTPGMHAWLQPMQRPHSGWGGSNPAYEEYYRKDVLVGSDTGSGAGWTFPALFRSDSTWLLVSESGLSRDDAGARLRSHAADGEYVIDLPDAQEPARGGTVLPQSTLPWRMPWRVIAIGSLRTIAESMLGVDVAIPSRTTPQAWIVPGKAAWSWPLLGDSSANFATQQRFIDYAADMRWRYVLVDAGWDVLIGATRIPELVAYANSRGVKLLLWYNSAGDWNTTPQTPRSRLLTHDDRVREFTWLHEAGVAGVKVDFFGSDAQGMIAYYHDILEDAAPFHLLVNFHGATLPRGWQRTYPHLMTMEAIKGLEFVTFDQRNADEEPRHATVIPFTRNVFDPMDFTPMVLDRIRNIERRTTSAFELALSVLFTSGIQHYAEIPDGMAKVPEFVRDFLRHVPSVWDDVRFLDGYPGSYVVMARRSGNRWYVSGINGDTIDRHLSLDLRILGKSGATLISDGDSHSFRADTLPLSDRGHVQLTLKPRGGFVLVTH